MFNSVLSTPGAKFMGIDLKDFYLCSKLDEYKYVGIPEHMLPDEIITLYNLKPNAEVRKGMYGLPQAGRLANLQLQKFLEPHTATFHAPSHPAYGRISTVTSNSHWLLTTLAFNTPRKPTLTAC
jgi:hypothetical protein